MLRRSSAESHSSSLGQAVGFADHATVNTSARQVSWGWCQNMKHVRCALSESGAARMLGRTFCRPQASRGGGSRFRTNRPRNAIGFVVFDLLRVGNSQHRAEIPAGMGRLPPTVALNVEAHASTSDTSAGPAVARPPTPKSRSSRVFRSSRGWEFSSGVPLACADEDRTRHQPART